MTHSGRWIALLGVVVAAALFVHDGVAPIVRLLAGAGWGLVVAALFHALPMSINARAWQVLLPGGTQVGFAAMAIATWLRESVNALLPVARIGGEIAAYRFVVGRGAPPARVAASIVVDVAVSLLSQGVFCLVGVALLVAQRPASGLALQAGLGFVVLVALGAVVAVLQQSGAFERLVRAADRFVGGRWSGLAEQSLRIDRAARVIYRRRRRIFGCFAWQLVGWALGAGEIWLALYFIGHAVTLTDALVFEAIVQAISSAAFIVPGALGVQEGGFLLVGAALGIDGQTALALAAARRLRDLVVYFPGLVVWQRAESRRGAAISRAPGSEAAN